MTNTLFLITFIVSIFAAICASADSPNFFALVGDVNLPEHRGTMFGFSNFMNGIGRAGGLGLCIVVQLILVNFVPLHLAWLYALSLTFLFFIPSGICYLLATRTVPQDVLNIKENLMERAH